MIPSLHCPATSSQEAAWNSKSCPEAFPSQKNGATTSSAIPRDADSASSHSRKFLVVSTLFGPLAGDFMRYSCNRKLLIFFFCFWLGRLWLLRLLAPDAPSILAVPAEERDKNTQAHDGKPQIDVPSVERRCRGDRSRGGQNQQQGRLALRQFLLFDHSRVTSRRCDAHSASQRRCLPALSSCQLFGQVNNLAHMVIGMPRTPHKNCKSVFRQRLPLRGVRPFPVRRSLLSNRLHHHGDRAVECTQRLVLIRRLLLREFPVPVAHVSRLRDARSDVIIQIAGQVQHQMPDAVSVGIRFAPELFVRKRVHPFVEMFSHVFVIRCQTGRHCFVQFRHEKDPFTIHQGKVSETTHRPPVLPPCEQDTAGGASSEVMLPLITTKSFS